MSRGIFSNEDLGLRSDSDESIVDDECSDPEHQIVSEKKTAVDHVSELQTRSARTQQLIEELDKIASIQPEAPKGEKLLKQMQVNKSKVIKREKAEFDKKEGERIRALKKKA